MAASRRLASREWAEARTPRAPPQRNLNMLDVVRIESLTRFCVCFRSMASCECAEGYAAGAPPQPHLSLLARFVPSTPSISTASISDDRVKVRPSGRRGARHRSTIAACRF